MTDEIAKHRVIAVFASAARVTLDHQQQLDEKYAKIKSLDEALAVGPGCLAYHTCEPMAGQLNLDMFDDKAVRSSRNPAPPT